MVDEGFVHVFFVLDGLATGGAEINVLGLMGALERLGVRCSLCSLTQANDGFLAKRLSELSVRRFDLDVRRLYDARGWLRFGRILTRERADIVHVQDPYGALLGMWAKSVTRLPVIFTRHVMTDEHNSMWDRLRGTTLRTAVRCSSDRVIAVSAAVAKTFSEQSGIPPARFSVVNNGVATPTFDQGTAVRIRQQMGWSPNARIVLMVGVMRPGKGHHLAIEAFAEVKRRVPDAHLVMAGDGPLRASIEAASEGNRNSISILGEVRNVPELMAASDVLVLPSESEAFPNVLLEAAMCGLPAIATKVGGIPEIIVHQETGLCVPPADPAALADAIVSVLMDPTLRNKMSDAARVRARNKFSLETQAAATLTIYEDILDKSASKRSSPFRQYPRVDSQG